MNKEKKFRLTVMVFIPVIFCVYLWAMLKFWSDVSVMDIVVLIVLGLFFIIETWVYISKGIKRRISQIPEDGVANN